MRINNSTPIHMPRQKPLRLFNHTALELTERAACEHYDAASPHCAPKGLILTGIVMTILRKALFGRIRFKRNKIDPPNDAILKNTPKTFRRFAGEAVFSRQYDKQTGENVFYIRIGTGIDGSKTKNFVDAIMLTGLEIIVRFKSGVFRVASYSRVVMESAIGKFSLFDSKGKFRLAPHEGPGSFFKRTLHLCLNQEDQNSLTQQLDKMGEVYLKDKIDNNK